jgi:hypothetical protein
MLVTNHQRYGRAKTLTNSQVINDSSDANSSSSCASTYAAYKHNIISYQLASKNIHSSYTNGIK